MGVPQLFKVLVSRYPLILKHLKDLRRGSDESPLHIDNLYLDFNQIIHAQLSTAKTKQQALFGLFAKIDSIVTQVLPRKVLFIAIDGVAPQAKLNEQRQRSYKKYRLSGNTASPTPTEKGEKTDLNYDKLIVGPGSQIMQEINEALRYYIQQKINADGNWQNLNVILSGPDVPGEGEHKILNYIRSQRTEKSYDPQTTHGFYGMDGDLVFLSLVCHEPNFFIFREEITHKHNIELIQRSEASMQFDLNLDLLSIGLLREYLEIELRQSLPFGYDFERVLDDFVAICFLVGGDFLPAMPFFRLDENGYGAIIDTYKRLLPSWGGYLVDSRVPKVDFACFRSLLIGLAEREFVIDQPIPDVGEESFSEIFSEIMSSHKVDKNNTNNNNNNNDRTFNKFIQSLGIVTSEKKSESGTASNPEQADPLQKEKEDLSDSLAKLLNIQRASVPEASSPSPAKPTVKSSDSSLSHSEKKKCWYAERTAKDVDDITPERVSKICQDYIRGFCWVANYYYQGCASWSWYYPHYAAPFASDLAEFLQSADSAMPSFDLEAPLQPLQQLVARVSPGVITEIQQELPESWRFLLSSDSPIADFFPTEFGVIHDVSGAEFRDVIVLPYVDRTRLLKATAHLADNATLTDVEKRRNAAGPTWFFSANETPSKKIQNPFANLLDPEWYWAGADTAHRTQYVLGSIPDARGTFVPHASQPLVPPFGLPTLRTLPFSVSKEKINVRVIQGRTYRGLTGNLDFSVVLTLKQPDVTGSEQDFIEYYLGKEVFCFFPYWDLGTVASIQTSAGTYFRDAKGRAKLNTGNVENPKEEFVGASKKLQEGFLTKSGIQLGNIQYIFVINLSSRGHTKRVPFQAILTDAETEKALRQTLKQKADYEHSLTKNAVIKGSINGQTVVMLKDIFYGYQGYVLNMKNKTFNLDITHDKDAAFVGFDPRNCTEKYYSLSEVGSMLKIPSLVISRLAGLVTFNPRLDLGLGMKFERRGLFTPGYARKGKRGWEFSESAMRLLQQFQNRFPEVIQAMINAPKADKYDGAEIYGASEWLQKLDELRHFLSAAPTAWLPLLHTRCETVDPPALQDLFRRAAVAREHSISKKRHAGLRREHFIVPGDAPPTRATVADFSLGDRVVCISRGVSFGLRGTVCGKEGSFLEVVFDREFLGASNMQGRLPRYCALQMRAEQLLNVTRPVVGAVSSDESGGSSSASSVAREGKKPPPKPTSVSNAFAMLLDADE